MNPVERPEPASDPDFHPKAYCQECEGMAWLMRKGHFFCVKHYNEIFELTDEEVDQLVAEEYEEALADEVPWALESYAYNHPEAE